ncbi:MAG: ABC transporter permease [Saccharofermentanales bacterium]
MLLESIKMAFRSLVNNKMRALLTMLGIIVGIASVIAIVSLGEGGKNEILGQFEQIGASTTIIEVRSSKAQTNDYITQTDIEIIRDNLDSVKYVTASIQKLGYASTVMDRHRIYLSAIDSDYNAFQPIEIVYGRLFTDTEYLEAFPVVIIDRTGALSFFGRENVVGEKLDIEYKGQVLKTTVIGICESLSSQYAGLLGGFGGDSADGRSIPFFVYTPFLTGGRIMSGQNSISSLNVMSITPERVDEAAASVIRVLEMRRGNSERAVYYSQNLASILDQINNVINIMTIFISAVAAISLLVGGIGVMNIMLVSVTERTREIGIRKAVGGTPSDILLQFITESIILTLFGGLIGILAGLGLAFGISFGLDYFGVGSITPVLSLKAVAIAVAFSTAVGLFFGIYPARKASLLNPIDALRYE